MVTAESGPHAMLIVWDLVQGKRLTSLKPYSDTIKAISFNEDSTMLVTVGTDAQHRFLIIVWDVQLLLKEKNISSQSLSSSGAIIARQISEFSIKQIRFSPFEEFGLVSCGRENIRFWRIRKGHLPGRPVLLNEYSRGYDFNEIAFYCSPGTSLNDVKKPSVFAASSKGLLIKINCLNDQVICAYQLHAESITSFAISAGYAVTGSVDCRLRIWPLDFNDFLLEAQHEGAVINIKVSSSGRKLAIGTAVGTIGVLNVSEHR